MNPNPQWQSPGEPPLSPPGLGRSVTSRSWLPAAIIGSAIVLAAGLIGGALILRKGDNGPTTCDSWTDTQAILRSIPALPDGWNWNTPGIDVSVGRQNAPVMAVLNVFESKIAAEPADVAQAARDYVSARRKQSSALADHSYTAGVGADVDTALQRLNQLCGITADGVPT